MYKRQATLTVTATLSSGEEVTKEWEVHSRNIDDLAVPFPTATHDNTDLVVGSYSTMQTGDLEMLAIFGEQGWSDVYLDADDPVFGQHDVPLAILPVNDNELFAQFMDDKLGIAQGSRGRLFEMIIRGYLIAWQVSWDTNNNTAPNTPCLLYTSPSPRD